MKIRPMLRSTLLASAVALSALPVAHATSLIGTGYSAVGSEPVSVTSPSANTNAGSFVGFWNGLPITFWCFELTEFFNFNVTYMDYVELPLTGYDDVARLFQEVGGPAGATSTLTRSAAFQLAIWEIRYETTTLPNYSLTSGSGNFYATSADPAAVAQANTWLQNLPATSTYQVSLLHSGPPGNEQDFVYATQPLRQNLPEPSPLPLLGLGVAAMMFSMRRRASISR